jgi:hypothetical protein
VTTIIYGIEEFEYGVTSIEGVYNTGMQRIDGFIKTYLRLRVASGEAMLADRAYQPLCIQDGMWRLAKDDGQRIPVAAVSIEIGASGEFMRGQRSGIIINNSGEYAWDWSAPSGEVWVANDGSMVRGVSGENWLNRQARVGMVGSATSVVIQL